MHSSSSTSSSSRPHGGNDEGPALPDATGARRGSRTLLAVVGCIVWCAVLAVWCECYARIGQWWFDEPAYVHRPLSDRVLKPEPAFVPGVAPVAHFQINQHGLRGSGPVATGDPDILIVGNSTLECLYLDQDATVSAQVQRTLADNGLEVEITTAAKSGMLSWHCAQLARAHLRLTDSIRCVVAMPTGGEVNRWLRGSAPTVTRAMQRALFIWPAAPEMSRRKLVSRLRYTALVRDQGKALLQWLHLAETEGGMTDNGSIYETWRRGRAAGRKVDVPEDRREALPAALREYRVQLNSLLENCRARDAELVLVTQPTMFDDQLTPHARELWWSGTLGDGGPLETRRYLTEEAFHRSMEDFNDTMRAFAADHGCLCVDLADTMREGEGRFFYDTVHLHDEGAREAGRIIGEAITPVLAPVLETADLRSETCTFPSSVTESIRTLQCRVAFRASWSGAPRPIKVVMHGLSGQSSQMLGVMAEARSAGFFAVAPEMRGRGESDGRPDIGGVEIHDIVDAVEHVKRQYRAYADPNTVVIEGFSGGGGNVLSAMTKFPDYWSAGLAWFGPSDYGFDPDKGLYHHGSARRRRILRNGIGDPDTPAGRAAYASRASYLGAANNPYADIHLFVEADEVLSPVFQSQTYTDAAREAGLANVTLHVGRDGVFKHGYPSWDALRYAHRLVWPDGAVKPVPPSSPRHGTSRWSVLGYLVTNDFTCWLGDGRSAVASLEYTREAGERRFSLRYELTPPAACRLEVRVAPDRDAWDVVVGDGPARRVPARDGVVEVSLRPDDREVIIFPSTMGTR